MNMNCLVDGFEGTLTASKWAALAKCLQDTALPAFASVAGGAKASCA